VSSAYYGNVKIGHSGLRWRTSAQAENGRVAIFTELQAAGILKKEYRGIRSYLQLSWESVIVRMEFCWQGLGR